MCWEKKQSENGRKEFEDKLKDKSEGHDHQDWQAETECFQAAKEGI